ncbi:MAG TPA: glycoside hydrolase family 13 protein [Candidatus Fimousia stercorigallinarum]|nr:glycoside hydrolase family 13 protein [Candidatus Fimousia stercorigallinarum]
MKRLARAERLHKYLFNRKPLIRTEGFFSDNTRFYQSPEEPTDQDDVRIRFRSVKYNIDQLSIVVNGQTLPMTYEKSEELFDYYSIIIPAGSENLSYYFQIETHGAVLYYNRKGTMRYNDETYNFSVVKNFSTPAWAKSAVMYQIFVDRFYNGDPSNDVLDKEYIYINEVTSKVTNWDKYPASMGVREFYGGDLQGVIDKLDYLQDLGVDVVYLNPVFVSPSNHKYDIQDYDYIDPHFGKIVVDEGELVHEGDLSNKNASRYICRVTDKRNLEASNQLFIKLVEEIHKRGMKIILDGVFNHCGSFNKWMDKERIYEGSKDYKAGAYISKDSPYHTFFKFYDNDSRFWPYNSSYDGWWGHDTLPKLNYVESPKLYKNIMNIARKWVSPPYNIDGWRLDVAADLGHSSDYNHQFWKEFRKTVKEANPNAIILAEHYGDVAPWLQGDEWDTVMNYDAFMEPLTWFLTGMEKHSDEYRADLDGNYKTFYDAMKYHMSRYHYPSLQVSMNELSNHDHSRFLTRTNKKVGRTQSRGPEEANTGVNKGIFKEAVLMQMTWPGAPTIYYGDEAGVTGWTDPDNRRTYPWGKEDKDLVDFHRNMIRIHKKYPAFMEGSVKFIHGEKNIFCYGRFTDEDYAVVILNNHDTAKKLQIPVWQTGVPDNYKMQQIMMTIEEGHAQDRVDYPIQNGYVTITMPPHAGAILHAVPDPDK